MTKRSTRSRFDWEKIGREYSLGKLTQQEIADKYGMSRSNLNTGLKRRGIRRDMTDAVRAATRAALVEQARNNAAQVGKIVAGKMASAVAGNMTTAADEAFQFAVAENVFIINSHKVDINETRGIVKMMLTELKLQTTPDILEALTALAMKAFAGDESSKRLDAALKSLELGSRATVARTLTETLAKLISMEREAHNIDDRNGGNRQSHDEWLLAQREPD